MIRMCNSLWDSVGLWRSRLAKPPIKVQDLNEITLKSEVVFQGSFLKVQRDLVKTPTGVEAIREYILHVGAAMIIPMYPDGSVLMIEQYRHSMKRVFLEFPAGRRDEGENSLLTAKRELREEVGLEAESWKFLGPIHPGIGFTDEQIDIYLAEDLTEVENDLDVDEVVRPVKKTIPELVDLFKSGQLTDVKTVIGLMWIWSKNRLPT